MNKKNDGYDKVFRALGDVHRIEILDLLMEREMNAGELLEAVDVVQSTLSHHMKSLCQSGLVTARKDGRWTYYAVSMERVQEARQFLKRYLDGETPEQDSSAPVQESILAQKDAIAKKTAPIQKAGVIDYSKKKEETEKEKPEKERPEKIQKIKKEKSRGGKKENKKDEKKKGKKQKKNGKK